MTGSVAALALTLRRRHGARTARAAFLLAWAHGRGVPPDRIARHLADVGLDAARTAAPRPADLPSPLDLKAMEQAFEALIGREDRRARGAVYTPAPIIDYLLAAAVDLGGFDRPPVILDPACGRGGFLVRAAALLEARFDLSPAEAARRLVGFDVDPDALADARCLLDLHLAERGVAFDPALFRLHEADTLLAPLDRLRALAGSKDGFDVVVTNPPYVKIQALSPERRAALAAAFPGITRGSFGLAPLFLLRGLDLLSERGVFGCITQNNLFTSLAGRGVRGALQDRRALARVVDFGHRHVFANASAYTCLLFLDRRRNPTFEYARCTAPPTAQALGGLAFEPIAHASLDRRKWRLTCGRDARNVASIERTGTPLGRLARIRVGIATLADPVFLVRPAGDRCVPLDGRDGYAIEWEATRPVCKVADVACPEDVTAGRLRVVFPYEERHGRFVPLEEAAFLGRFPGARAWLEANRAALARRDKGRRDYGAWFAWGRTQSMSAPGPKLLTKTFHRGPAFYLDPSDQLFCNGYSVTLERPPAAGPGLTLPLLQRILGSAVMDYHARLTSFQIEGAFQCFQKNFIARFGVLDVTADDAAALLTLDGEAFDREIVRRYGLDWDEVQDVRAVDREG